MTTAQKPKRVSMKLRVHVALAAGCGLIAAFGLRAQSTPASNQQKPQQPAQQQPAQKPPTDSNPFPQDMTKVPIVPINGEPAAAPAAAPAADEPAVTTSLLKSDTDPVHSPDDPVGDASSSDGFSSSLAGSNDVNIPEDETPAKHRRGQQEPAVHQETAKEDESVGDFELSRKNWRAALSRYQSALVTDPDNPDVYWGIAEAKRALGDYASAKANYQKVVDYDDPESKHSKEAKKLLKTPQLANAPAMSVNQSPGSAAPQRR
jgi:tetratricopeptide (TPR) repeat protein